MSGKRLRWYQVVLSLVCTIVLIIGVTAGYRANLFRQADYFLYDLHYKWRGPLPVSGMVGMVLMDEKSAQELNRKKGSWSRRQLAAALDNLCAAGAEVIGLDLVLSAQDVDPETDQVLARALENCNNVVLARVSTAEGVKGVEPLPLFQEVMIGDGFIDVQRDEDEVLRRIRFLNASTLEDGSLQLLPSMSLELARNYRYLDFDFDFSLTDFFKVGAKDQEQMVLPYPELLINYYGDYSIFPNLVYADVVMNRFDPEAVKGRIFIFGTALTSDKDFYTTPYSRFQKAVVDKSKFAHVEESDLGQQDIGVSSHANAVETILSQKFISRTPALHIVRIAVLFGVLGLLFYVPQIGMIFEVLLLAAGLGITVWVSHLLFLKYLIWVETAPFLAMLLCQFVVGVMLQKVFDKKRTSMVSGLFGKYVSPSVVQELIKGDIEASLVGHRENLTMLFSDIRGFTTISERLGAKDTSILLNHYFDDMLPIVMNHQGTLDKLMGDAVMAFFGDPVPVPDHPVKAAEASLKMLEQLDKLKRESTVKGMADLQIGIGLNTAEVTVGNLGSQEFMDYTIIGDGVNLASRLEGINKVYGTRIIISEFTAAELDERFLMRELDLVKVKGKDKAVAIFELICYSAEATDEQKRLVALFGEGLAAFRSQDWDGAAAKFSEILGFRPEEKTARLYLDRIDHFRDNPPGDGWDGVTAFDHK